MTIDILAPPPALIRPIPCELSGRTWVMWSTLISRFNQNLSMLLCIVEEKLMNRNECLCHQGGLRVGGWGGGKVEETHWICAICLWSGSLWKLGSTNLGLWQSWTYLIRKRSKVRAAHSAQQWIFFSSLYLGSCCTAFKPGQKWGLKKNKKTKKNVMLF